MREPKIRSKASLRKSNSNSHAAGGQAGSIHGAMETPYFYTAPNVARVNLAMEIPSDSLKFDKQKGKYHANINVLGIAYRPDGTVGARFSDTVNLDLEKDEWKEFTKTAVSLPEPV